MSNNHSSPSSSSSFVVPINPHSPLEPQSGFPSPNLSLPGSFSQSGGASSSSRSYRHSSLLEGGKYQEDWNTTSNSPRSPYQSSPQSQQQFHQPGATSLLPYSQSQSSPHHHHRQTRSVGRVPSLSHLQQQQQQQGQSPRNTINHRASMVIPSNFGLGLGGSSTSDSISRGDVTMGYSGQASPSPQSNSSSYMSHYRASPSVSGGIGVGMSRGLSHDGVTMSGIGGGGGTPSRAHPPTLQTNSLLPTSYAPNSAGGGGRPMSYAGGPGGGYTPMSGVQQQHTGSSTSPRMQAPPSPSSRFASTSTSTSSAPPPPPPMSSSSTAPASSFYPQHIAQSYSTGTAIQQQHQQVSASTSASTSTSSLSLSPNPPHSLPLPHHPPPPQSVSPQQYYQSQHYLDHQMKQSTTQSSPSVNQSTSSPSSHFQPQGFYSSGTSVGGGGGGGGGGTDLRSLSLNSSSTLHSPNLAAGSSSSSSSMFGASSPQMGKKKGLRKVRDVNEIERKSNVQPRGRRADPAGGFISPLKALTTHLPQTYNLVNPSFHYETSLNPRRVLTKPSKPAQNDGFDNEDSDYILYVNDVLGPEDKDRYLILDVLGQGTFGQVVKCQNMKTHEIVAVKVVKNKPAYFQQSMMEVTILELINNQWDKDDEHHMLRLKDTFIHHSHLCLVFELLSNNLYELIKQNSFRGLSTSLVRVFTAQLLDAMAVLAEAKIIHCDLKPENILLKSLQSPTIKVIDFGSACHEKQTVYTYIQSRFYRSPEVILSLPYSAMIDMWSLGCICVELFLGLPLFPGTSEFNQITRIVEMLGMPPDHMLDKGKQTSHFFETFADEYGRRRYRLKSLERYSQEYKANEQPSKKYFSASTLPEIIKQYPIVRKGLKEAEIDKEMRNRIAFIDFVQGLLHLDPEQRWTPAQARMHPFVLGEPLTTPFVPPPRHGFSKQSSTSSSTSPIDPKRPYGGLPPAPNAGRPRQTYDAKAYAQQLNQQQGYNVQAQQAAQRASQIPTNPYAADVQAQAYAQAQAQAHAQAQAQAQAQAAAAARQQQLPQSLYGPASGGYAGRTGGGGGGAGPNPASVANPPAVHHYTTRGRSGTVGQELPPALQKLGHDLSVHSGTGQSITPVLRREDQWQAWERSLQEGNGVQRRISISTKNPHLNLLQEQAELNSWNSPARAKQQPSTYGSYYASPHQPSQPQFSVVVDDGAAPGSSTRPSHSTDIFGANIAAPPLAYSASNPSSRYAPYPSSAGTSNPSSILPLSQAPPPPPGAGNPLSGMQDPAFDLYHHQQQQQQHNHQQQSPNHHRLSQQGGGSNYYGPRF